MLLAALLSTVVSQPVPGTWTGYVGGWVPSEPRTVTAPRRAAVVPVAVPVVVWSVAPAAPLVERRPEPDPALVQQQRLAEQQSALIAQQQAAQAQWLAQQQQLAAEQQAQAAREERRRAEEATREAEAAVKRATEERDRALAREREAQEAALAEREAARAAAAREAEGKPKEKGPEIYRWVDEDGVVHYSTNPRR